LRRGDQRLQPFGGRGIVPEVDPVARQRALHTLVDDDPGNGGLAAAETTFEAAHRQANEQPDDREDDEHLEQGKRARGAARRMLKPAGGKETHDLQPRPRACACRARPPRAFSDVARRVLFHGRCSKTTASNTLPHALQADARLRLYGPEFDSVALERLGRSHLDQSQAWCPLRDLNPDLRFRKPLLYPVELRGRRASRAWTIRPGDGDADVDEENAR